MKKLLIMLALSLNIVACSKDEVEEIIPPKEEETPNENGGNNGNQGGDEIPSDSTTIDVPGRDSTNNDLPIPEPEDIPYEYKENPKVGEMNMEYWQKVHIETTGTDLLELFTAKTCASGKGVIDGVEYNTGIVTQYPVLRKYGPVNADIYIPSYITKLYYISNGLKEVTIPSSKSIRLDVKRLPFDLNYGSLDETGYNTSLGYSETFLDIDISRISSYGSDLEKITNKYMIIPIVKMKEDGGYSYWTFMHKTAKSKVGKYLRLSHNKKPELNATKEQILEWIKFREECRDKTLSYNDIRQENTLSKVSQVSFYQYQFRIINKETGEIVGNDKNFFMKEHKTIAKDNIVYLLGVDLDGGYDDFNEMVMWVDIKSLYNGWPSPAGTFRSAHSADSKKASTWNTYFGVYEMQRPFRKSNVPNKAVGVYCSKDNEVTYKEILSYEKRKEIIGFEKSSINGKFVPTLTGTHYPDYIEPITFNTSIYDTKVINLGSWSINKIMILDLPLCTFYDHTKSSKVSYLGEEVNYMADFKVTSLLNGNDYGHLDVAGHWYRDVEGTYIPLEYIEVDYKQEPFKFRYDIPE